MIKQVLDNLHYKRGLLGEAVQYDSSWDAWHFSSPESTSKGIPNTQFQENRFGDSNNIGILSSFKMK